MLGGLIGKEVRKVVMASKTWTLHLSGGNEETRGTVRLTFKTGTSHMYSRSADCSIVITVTFGDSRVHNLSPDFTCLSCQFDILHFGQKL